MTITNKLEGLLPADGNYTTKDERVIAEAVKELREAHADIELIGSDADTAWRRVGVLQERITRASRNLWVRTAMGFAAGCIASAIYVVLV